jgi:transcriptional regulator with XRE-family HTH domain
MPKPTWEETKRRRAYRSIGKALQSARRDSKLRLGDIAAKAGRSASYCSQLECGYYAPSIDTLRAWAAACGVTLSELLTGAA